MRLYFDDIVIKNKKLLHGGELIVPDTGITVIQGQNGCGKTMLLKNIFSNKKNANVPMVFIDQNNNSILTGVDVLKNISMSYNEEKCREIEQRLKDFGFDYLLEHSASKLSGGEKRLVNLFRGILSAENVLLIDEPTNDLDNKTVKKIAQILYEIAKDRSVIIITHDDRLLSANLTIYKIMNERLLNYSNIEFDASLQNNDLNLTESKPQKDLGFLNKVFHFNFISVAFSIIFIIISIFQVLAYVDNVPKENPKYIKENQINVYNTLSVSANNKIFDGIYPAVAVNLFYEKNPFARLTKYNKLLKLEEDLSNKNISFNLDLASSSEYTVLPFEFYDVANKRTYFTMESYLQKNYNVSWNVATVDTLAVFDMPFEVTYIENPISYPFDIEKFLECAEELKSTVASSGQKYEIVCSVIVLKDNFTREDFYKSEVFNEFSKNSSCLICSNDIIDCIREVSQFKNIVDCCIVLIIAMVAIMFFDALFLVLFLKLFKGNIFLVKNYAYDLEEVRTRAVKKINNRYPKILLFAIFVIINIILCRIIPFSWLSGIFSIILALFYAIDFWIGNKITLFMINKYYSWAAR